MIQGKIWGNTNALIVNPFFEFHRIEFKAGYKFAFAGYAGASYKFTPELTGELSYSYRNLGKLGKDKDFKDSDNPFELRGHHVAAGVRFDI